MSCLSNQKKGELSGIFQILGTSAVKKYVKAIRSRNPNAKILVTAAEGNYIYQSGGVRWVEEVLRELRTLGVSVNGLAFHIYADGLGNPPLFTKLSPFPNRYFAIGKGAASNWVTDMSHESYGLQEGMGIPRLLLKVAASNSGYPNAKSLELFATEYSLLASESNESNVKGANITRSTMLNALVLVGLTSELSRVGVKAILPHALGQWGYNGWNSFNTEGRTLPWVFATRMISTLYPHRAKTQVLNSSAFSISGAALEDEHGTIPAMNNVPKITALATMTSDKMRMKLLMVNYSSVDMYPKISIIGKSAKSVSVSQLKPGSNYGDAGNSDDFLDSNDYMQRISIQDKSLAPADLERLYIPHYSISVVSVTF